MKQIDLNKYKEFVKAVTSEDSNSTSSMCETIDKLESASGVNMSLLLTGAVGISAESGEFMEIVKKCIFQGKPLDDDTQYHAKRELGDIMWYWVNACRALNVDPNIIIQMNIDKLKARYPGGDFDAYYSENRKDGDI
jgi:NTP pyrophosphatase (non-canonical NTP hydrolase)